MTPEERARRSRLASYTSWANTVDRTARTAAARSAFEQKFLDEAGGDPKRAEALRKVYFLRLAEKSVKARKARRPKQKPACPEFDTRSNN